MDKVVVENRAIQALMSLGRYQLAYEMLLVHFDEWVKDDYHYKGRELCERLLVYCPRDAEIIRALLYRYMEAETPWKIQ